jgi:FkbM family methyltransferase
MSNSIQVRVERLYLVVSTTKNWPIAILIWLGLINFGLVRFKNNELFKLSKANWVQYLERVYLFHYFPDAKIFDEIVKFNYKNKDLVFDCGRYGLGTVLEIFAGEPYREFFETTKIKGKTVLDIGAAFGDTAIAFLLAGAGRVYAVEAFPGYCRLASKNIETNGLDSKCEVMLAAVGGVAGTLTIDINLEEMFGIGVQEKEIGDNIPIVTLEQIMEDKDINDAILKIDVEGYEYEILLNTPIKVLRQFSDMVIEYHYGPERITNYLKEAGFNLNYTGPFAVRMPHLIDKTAQNMSVGNIYAHRMN